MTIRTATTAGRPAPFGRLLTAMVTPFDAHGALDLDAAGALAAHLVEAGNEGLVVNGTTGEAGTTSDAEKDALLRTVVATVGDRAGVLAGVGTNDTKHSIELARAAERAGADGLLVVTPYYSKPPQEGLLAHFRAVADATGLPVMTYDIPSRTGTALQPDTLLRLAEHPRIVANKDAKGDLAAATMVMAGSDLAYYSGDDALTLPLLACGAVGVVSVTGHLVADRIAAMMGAYDAGAVGDARDLHAELAPVTVEVMTRMQGAVAVKAALARAGVLPHATVRLPLVAASPEQADQLGLRLDKAGVR